MKSHQQPISSKNTQQGMALIAVLVVVAIMGLFLNQTLLVRQQQTQAQGFYLHHDQLLSVVWGAEQWVGQSLSQSGQFGDVDDLHQLWAQPFAPVPFEGGMVGGKVEDLNRWINVNNLWQSPTANHPTDAEVAQTQNERWLTIVQRLWQQQGLNPAWLDVLLDWIDEDTQPRPYGAEDEVYLLQSPPYRTANQALVSLQELSLMAEYNAQSFVAVQQQLVAVPGVMKVNINTADKPVLLALSEHWDESTVESFLLLREEESFSSTADFRSWLKGQLSLTEEDVLTAFPDDIITVKSTYFRLTADLNYGEASTQAVGIFQRDNKNRVQLIRRQLKGGFVDDSEKSPIIIVDGGQT